MKKTRQEEMLKPVERVEVSDKHVKLRIVCFVLAVLVAMGALGYGIYRLIRVDGGWQKINAAAGNEYSCANEFSFFYYLGAGDMSVADENRAVTNAYTEACINAYRMFAVTYEASDNIYALNKHPNEEITLNPYLASSLKKVADSDSRLVLLAPLYARYDNIFFSATDTEAKNYDPHYSAEEREYFDRITEFVNNPEHISLEFLSDNKVKLKVSEQYLAYARENAVDALVDFHYLKNAFITDYLAQEMEKAGFVRGTFSSIDGYTRTLSTDGISNTVTLYDNVNGLPYACSQIVLKKAFSAVNLSNFKVRSGEQYYYSYADGRTVTPFLDPSSGKDKTANAFLTGYSETMSCSDVLLKILPTYIADGLEENRLKKLEKDGIYSVFARGKVVYYNQNGLEIAVSDKNQDNVYSSQLF